MTEAPPAGVFAALCIKRTKKPESLTAGFYYPAAMQDKSIDGALLALCKFGGEQGKLAGRLLVMRGVEPPEPSRYPKNAARHRETRQLVLDALRAGPKHASDIGAVIREQKPELTRRAATNRAYIVLYRLREAGLVGREGRLWFGKALLRKSVEGQTSPYPGQAHPAGFVNRLILPAL